MKNKEKIIVLLNSLAAEKSPFRVLNILEEIKVIFQFEVLNKNLDEFEVISFSSNNIAVRLSTKKAVIDIFTVPSPLHYEISLRGNNE